MHDNDCTTCHWAEWKQTTHGGDITTHGGTCALPLDLPHCYITKTKHHSRWFPARKAINRWTPPGCKYYINRDQQ